MISEKAILLMPKTTRVSFLKSAVTAQTTYVSALQPGGAYNDAVLELHRLNYLLNDASTIKD